MLAMDFVWPLWKSNLAAILTNHEISTLFDLAIRLLGIFPEAIIKKTTKAMCKKVFIVVVFIIVRTWIPSDDPWVGKWFSKLCVCISQNSPENRTKGVFVCREWEKGREGGRKEERERQTEREREQVSLYQCCRLSSLGQAEMMV